jgi:hypothetical protein
MSVLREMIPEVDSFGYSKQNIVTTRRAEAEQHDVRTKLGFCEVK